MKKINLIFLSVIALLLLSFTVLQINTNSLFVESYEDIGTIKQSILKPELFNKTQKGVWVLLDGRELEHSTELYQILVEGHDLNILKDSKELPDARGKFIRSSNYLGKGSDPDTSRLVGTVQSDTFKLHQHGYGGNFLNNAGTNIWSLYGTKPSDNWSAKTNNSSGKNSNRVSLTSKEGDSETRPINISMYTYIKLSK